MTQSTAAASQPKMKPRHQTRQWGGKGRALERDRDGDRNKREKNKMPIAELS